MDVQVISTKVEHFPKLGRYFFADLACGRHTISISISGDAVVDGQTFRGAVRVINTSNASHRAWRGMGRSFPNIEAALKGYKMVEIKAMISMAYHANREALAVEAGFSAEMVRAHNITEVR